VGRAGPNPLESRRETMAQPPWLWRWYHSAHAMNPTLLVVDDDAASRRLVTATFGVEGFRVVSAEDGPAGIAAANIEHPDVVLLDMQMPTMNGLEVLEALTKSLPRLPVVMLTADREVKTALRATRLGAFDYLTKPIDHDEVVAVVKRALEASALRKEVDSLRRQLTAGGVGLAEQMGHTEAVRDVVDQVNTVAASDFTVLVLGETGTGKELVAQAIHRASARREKPFLALDCGAIPEPLLESELFGHERGAFTGADRKRHGRFELARGGTLFLDEIGNLPLGLQAKLLRVLESKEVVAVGGARATELDVRFIAATNDDLEARAAAGAFRADLYYRLAQYTIALPPLRDRRADVAYLARRFLDEASIELRRPVREIAPDALADLERHAWPGNVRELRNVVRQAVIRSKDLVLRRDVLRAVMGKPKVKAAPAAGSGFATSLKEIAEEAARAAEKQAICEALRVTQGNKSKAARALKTDYKTLHLKMQRLGVRARDFQP
jgi:DNA-binding NtrC family response regulator